MTGLDIEAIRERARRYEKAHDGEMTVRAAAGMNSAADVPKLLAQIERERSALDEALATVREQAVEIERLRTELAGEQREHQVDMREAGADIRNTEAALADALQVIADLRGGTT